MFELIGDTPNAAAAHAAKTVMAMETALANSVPDARRTARSLQPVSQGDSGPVAGADAVISTGTITWRTAAAPPVRMFNVTEPEFFRAARTSSSKARAWTTGRPTCAGTSPTVRRPISRRHSCKRDFDFYSQVSARRAGDAAALEAVRVAGGPRPGRGAGPGVRRRRLSARVKQRTLAMTQEIEDADAGR